MDEPEMQNPGHDNMYLMDLNGFKTPLYKKAADSLGYICEIFKHCPSVGFISLSKVIPN